MQIEEAMEGQQFDLHSAPSDAVEDKTAEDNIYIGLVGGSGSSNELDESSNATRPFKGFS